MCVSRPDACTLGAVEPSGCGGGGVYSGGGGSTLAELLGAHPEELLRIDEPRAREPLEIDLGAAVGVVQLLPVGRERREGHLGEKFKRVEWNSEMWRMEF